MLYVFLFSARMKALSLADFILFLLVLDWVFFCVVGVSSIWLLLVCLFYLLGFLGVVVSYCSCSE